MTEVTRYRFPKDSEKPTHFPRNDRLYFVYREGPYLSPATDKTWGGHIVIPLLQIVNPIDVTITVDNLQRNYPQARTLQVIHVGDEKYGILAIFNAAEGPVYPKTSHTKYDLEFNFG